MDVKILLLMNCVAVVYCQNTISGREDADWHKEFFVDVKSEIESIRQLLMNQKKDDVCNDKQAMQEMKSEIQDIRRIVSDQNQVMETLRDKWHEIGCPHGFDYLPKVDSCFKLISEAMTWENATERCRKLWPGTYLAAITSETENDAIVRYLQVYNSSMINKDCISARWPDNGYMIWIGGQTRNANRCGDPYVWKTQRGIEIPFNYINWAPYEPDCFESKEHCVHIGTGSYRWKDGDCDSLSCAICELHM